MKKIGFPIVLAVLAGCSPGDPEPNETPGDRYVIVTGDGELAAGTATNGCVKDKISGLTWELKSDRAGLRDWRNTYSWFNPNQAHHEIDYRGTEDGGACEGSTCDTWGVVHAANKAAICGYNDWRMPSKDELFSISDLRKLKTPPTTDTEYFQHTQSAEYWSANDYSFQPDSAWAWSFQYGHDRVDWKKSPKFVRLVRGEAAELKPVKE